MGTYEWTEAEKNNMATFFRQIAGTLETHDGRGRVVWGYSKAGNFPTVLMARKVVDDRGIGRASNGRPVIIQKLSEEQSDRCNAKTHQALAAAGELLAESENHTGEEDGLTSITVILLGSAIVLLEVMVHERNNFLAINHSEEVQVVYWEPNGNSHIALPKF